MTTACAGLVGGLAWSGLQAQPQQPARPLGKWQIEFSNKVVEICQIEASGEVFVDEARRLSAGKAVQKGEVTVISFADNRLERWTPVGNRFVVEHWAQGNQLPVTAPVLGIAERTP